MGSARARHGAEPFARIFFLNTPSPPSRPGDRTLPAPTSSRAQGYFLDSLLLCLEQNLACLRCPVYIRKKELRSRSICQAKRCLSLQARTARERQKGSAVPGSAQTHCRAGPLTKWGRREGKLAGGAPREAPDGPGAGSQWVLALRVTRGSIRPLLTVPGTRRDPGRGQAWVSGEDLGSGRFFWKVQLPVELHSQ